MKTVSLDPFVERMIRRQQAAMLENRWRNANFSLSMNLLTLATFFDHAEEGDNLHRETVRQMNQWVKGTLKLSEKDFEKWSRWIAKVSCLPEAHPNSK